MRDGIVITGMGVVTPVGIGVDTYWENLTAGVCGIGEITQIDTTALPIHRAAEVYGFHPKDFMPTRLALDLEPYQQYAYAAAEQALAQSGLTGFGPRRPRDGHGAAWTDYHHENADAH